MKIPASLRKRKPDTHKGDYGYVLVLGGSPGLTGAVCLCAQAALKIGAGLVKVGVPKSLNSIFEIKLTEVMSLPLKEQAGCLCLQAWPQIEEILDKIDVVALGCGASTAPSPQKLMREVIKKIKQPLIVDADGLNALAGNLALLNKRKTRELILTPHLGEFSRLVKKGTAQIKKKRKQLAKEFARRYKLTLVLKGDRTLVTDGQRLYENSTGNPGLATAGAGDVLTGMISGLLGQGLSCWEAARLGVYLHGLAADYAARDKTEQCLIASDIIDYLPKAVKKLIK